MTDDRDLNLIPLICPQCGARLTVETGGVIFPCGACQSYWEPAEGRLERRELTILAGYGDLHLPYWLIPFRIATSGGLVTTLAEFRRLTGNITTLEPERHETTPIAFVPAGTGVAPHLMVRAGRLLTLRSPALVRTSTVPSRLATIGYCEADAAVMARTVVLAVCGEERRRNLNFLTEFRVTTGTGKLCAIPFEERGGRYLHTDWSLEV